MPIPTQAPDDGALLPIGSALHAYNALPEGFESQLDLFIRGIPRVQVRLVREAVASYSPRIQVHGPVEVAAFLKDYFADRATEEFLVVTLSSNNCVINVGVLFRGGIASSIVEPRSVFQLALLANAASVILVHNHPSGNPEPSQADMAITNVLVAAGKVMGIPVQDHLIMTGCTYTSFAERGLITATVPDALTSSETPSGEGSA